MNNIIFISGIPSSGKSHVAKEYEQKGYHLISLDKVIEHKIIPLFKKEIKTKFGGKKHVLYGIYHPKNYGDVIGRAREKFIKVVKGLIKEQIDKGKKVVVEGAILNEHVLKSIFGKNDNYTFYFILPKSKKEYKKRFVKRFVDDPDNYGRLGRLRKMERLLDSYCFVKQNNNYPIILILNTHVCKTNMCIKDKDRLALKDYKKNKLKGKIISKLIDKVIYLKYMKIVEWLDHYTKWNLDINYLTN